jgi:peroxiredoxin
MAAVGEKVPDFTLPSDTWEPRGLARGGAAGGNSGFVLLPWRLVERVRGPGGQVQQEISSFEEKGARVLAMSVDSP